MPKILAIDDDYLFREILTTLLEENSFQAIDADNGLLGLQLVKEQNPDLILCDIRMPELNGYDVLIALRQDPRTEKIPFIFLSAEQTDSDRDRAIELGANDCLNKLSPIENLMKAIKAQLQ